MRHLLWILCLAGSWWLPAALMADGHDGDFERTASGSSGQAQSSELQIERLARFYRIQNYEMNRLDRAEYDRRADDLQRRVDAWRQAGQTEHETQVLIDWLQRSLGGETSPQPIARPTEPLPVPQQPSSARSSDTSALLQPDLAPQWSGQADETAKGHQDHLEPQIESAATPLPKDESLPRAARQDTVAEPTAPQLSVTGDESSDDHSLLGGIRSTIDDLVKRVEQIPAISQLPDSVPPPVTLPTLADVPDAPPYVSPAFVPQKMPKLDVDLPKVGGLAGLRGATRAGDKSGTATSGEEGKVNFTEVAALTRAYNVSLQELETKLSKASNWTADKLEPLVDDLEQLARRRQDLVLYDNALPPEEKSQLTSRDSLDQAIRLTGKRIAEVRKEITEQAGGNSEGRRDLTQLDGFSRRLAALASEQER